MSIPVNYSITKTVPAKQTDSYFYGFVTAWDVDIEAIRKRLEAIGYTCAVSRALPDKITVNFSGVPNYFGQYLQPNDWRVQAELDVESALKLQQAGLLNSTYMATPITPITNAPIVAQVGTSLDDTLQAISNNLPNSANTATVLGLTTPVIIAGGLLLLIVILKK